MKWFRNKKIAFKLLSTFILIALIAGGVGVYGVISLNKMNTTSNNMFVNDGVSQGYLGYVYGDFNNQRALMNDVLLYSDSKHLNKDKISSDIEKVDASKKMMEDNLAKYKITCVTEEDKAGYTKLETAINNYMAVEGKIIEEEQQGEYELAANYMRDSEAVQTADNTQATIENTVADNAESGNKTLQAQRASANTTMILLIAVSAAAVIIALLLGLFLTKIIAKPLKHLAGCARQISAGDMEIAKTSFSQKDEVGEMFDSVRGILNAVKKLSDDTQALTESAMNGDLMVRADASRHQGEYRKIIEGVNGAIDEIVKPVGEAISVIDGMSHGNLENVVTGDYKGDLANVKIAVNFTIGKLKEIIGEISYTLGEMSKGNFDVEIISEYQGNFTEVKESINGIIASLNNTMMDINTSADQVSAGARQVSDGVQETSQGATEQASSIEELTASITQIAQQTKQNAMSANNANELTVSAVSNATHGNEQMKGMQQAMSEISESSRNINKIIKVIDDIAFQTNILALNAAVEAARAGVHGKGFAVVAEEVRNLAARSANAAKETTDLIEGSISKTEAGTKIANETAKALSNIVEGVDKAAKLVSEIARASNEQAGAIAQVNSGIEQMSQVVQTNSATAEESAAASEELSSQAELLKNMVGKFRLKGAAQHRKASQPVIAEKVEETGEKQKSPVINMNDADFGKY